MARKKTTTDAHYFPFRAKDWRSSESVGLMSLAERGAFIELLAIAWLSSDEPCTIPADDAAIAALLHIPIDEWQRYAPRVLAEFDDTTPTGRLRNESLWRTYQDMRVEHRKRVQGGRTSALRRRDAHGRLLPALHQDSIQHSTKSLGKSLSGSQSQSQSQVRDTSAAPVEPAPVREKKPSKFPHLSRADCDRLYQVWSKFGSHDYPVFRKAIGPLFEPPASRTVDDVEAGMREAIARSETGRDAVFLTIHTFVQRAGYWIDEARGRQVVDPSTGTLLRAV